MGDPRSAPFAIEVVDMWLEFGVCPTMAMSRDCGGWGVAAIKAHPRITPRADVLACATRGARGKLRTAQCAVVP